MICSEFVYQCFAKAKPSGKYRLNVEPSFCLTEEYQNLKLKNLHKRLGSIFTKEINLGKKIYPEFVSPRDLEESNSLRLIGRLR